MNVMDHTPEESAAYQRGYLDGYAAGIGRSRELADEEAAEAVARARAVEVARRVALTDPWEVRQAKRRRREEEAAAAYRAAGRPWPPEDRFTRMAAQYAERKGLAWQALIVDAASQPWEEPWS